MDRTTRLTSHFQGFLRNSFHIHESRPEKIVKRVTHLGGNALNQLIEWWQRSGIRVVGNLFRRDLRDDRFAPRARVR